jgi:hypothetical protein
MKPQMEFIRHSWGGRIYADSLNHKVIKKNAPNGFRVDAIAAIAYNLQQNRNIGGKKI